jgi:membrane protease YdiL (CAAX protease family)
MFFGAEEIGTLILVELYPKLRNWSSSTTNRWLSSFAIEFWLIVICYPLILLAFWQWFFKAKPLVRRAVGLIKPKLSNVAWAALGLISFYILSALVIELAIQLAPSLKANSQLTQQLNITSVHGSVEIIAAVVGLSIIDPITEELVFRGVIFTSLKRRMPVFVAAIVTSVIFAIPHMLQNTDGILYTVGIGIFILSLILCWVRQKTGNIYTSMLIHSVVNAISLIALIKTH